MALVEDGALLGSRQLDMGNSGSLYGDGECGKDRKCFVYLPRGPLGVSGTTGLPDDVRVIKLGGSELWGLNLGKIDDVTVIVESVLSGSPAERGGMEAEDIIKLRETVLGVCGDSACESTEEVLAELTFNDLLALLDELKAPRPEIIEITVPVERGEESLFFKFVQ